MKYNKGQTFRSGKRIFRIVYIWNEKDCTYVIEKLRDAKTGQRDTGYPLKQVGEHVLDILTHNPNTIVIF